MDQNPSPKSTPIVWLRCPICEDGKHNGYFLAESLQKHLESFHKRHDAYELVQLSKNTPDLHL